MVLPARGKYFKVKSHLYYFMLGVWDEDGRLSLPDTEFSATGGFALRWALGHVWGYSGGVSWHLGVETRDAAEHRALRGPVPRASRSSAQAQTR